MTIKSIAHLFFVFLGGKDDHEREEIVITSRIMKIMYFSRKPEEILMVLGNTNEENHVENCSCKN